MALPILYKQKQTILYELLSFKDKRQKGEFILKHLPELSQHRHFFSRGNSIPHSLKNAIADYFKAEGIEPSEHTYAKYLKIFCEQWFRANKNALKDPEQSKKLAVVREAYTMAEFILAHTGTGHFSSISTAKGFFIGSQYKILNYIRYARANPSSLYNAKLYQQDEFSKYIIFVQKLNDPLLNQHLSDLTCAREAIIPNLDEDFALAKRSDWQARINGQKVHDYIVSILAKNPDTRKWINQQSNKWFFSRKVKQLLKASYITAQYERLNDQLAHTNQINLSSDKILISKTIKVCDTNPAIIRGNYHLLPPETRDNPINLYQHNLSLANESDSAINLIRCGHIHSKEAAKQYVTEMIKLTKPQAITGERLIVDNRLMYNVSIPRFGESKIINQHQAWITEAIAEHNETNPQQQIKALFLNFPPKKYLQNSTANQEALNSLYEYISKHNEHKNLLAKNSKYEKLFKMFEQHWNNSKYYSGKDGYNFAFILQYLCSCLEIGFSEGCKSNKDRGSMKKMHDEIYYAKLQQSQSEEPEDIEQFFTLKPKDIAYGQQIVLNNSSAHITQLNTSYSGNKNTAGVDELLANLGFKDKRTFIIGKAAQVGT
jgi:hypothetical protein